MKTKEHYLKPKREAPQYLTAMIARMEELVVSLAENLIRACVWLKLVTIWACVRGEDSTWLDPSTARHRPNVGLTGNLTRTKSTGAGKKVRNKELFVSCKAYVSEKDWLETGWDLWQSAPLPRENFLCLPKPDLQGFRDVGASDQDRVALTRHMLDRILANPRGDGEKPTTRLASKFWTEHFSRSTIVSMARVFGTPKDITDRLDGWVPSRSTSETYIRTHRKLAEMVQEKVATVRRRH